MIIISAVEPALVFIFGLCIGSFLNVVIYRVPRKISLVDPLRSFCPQCKTTLTWMDNIPVISWLLALGRCRYCKEPIPGQYPLVEALTGAAAVLTHLYWGLTPSGFIIFGLTSALIAITFIDFEHRIIPDLISKPGITLGFILGIAVHFGFHVDRPLTHGAADSLFGALAGAGFFWIIGWAYFVVTKEDGLGMGDVKLMAMTGAFLGIDSVAPTIFLGSLFGSVVGVLLIIIGRGNRKSEIPFGPWLSLAAILYAFTEMRIFV